MSTRLPIPASRIADVASAALVSRETVLRYRQENGDGTPRRRLLRATEAAITRAVRSLPEDKQMELGAVTTRINRSGVSPTMGQPGEVRSCPVGLDDCTPPTPTLPAGRSAAHPRPRLVFELPAGVAAPEPDGRHWYEEREST
jgi:hypothetical protein